MAPSGVSSVLNLRDALGNHAETRSGAYNFYGDAASFHKWVFRTRLRIAGKTGDQYSEATSKVCDGQRGDAFVAAQEVGSHNLCEIVDGTPRGTDTLINHMRGMVFPCPDNTENVMNQYVSRRRRCWTLLVQMDPVTHLGEGHRSDVLLDPSGLTREERVMVQASIYNERDIDRVAEALIIQHPRIHLRESQRRTKGKGKDGFTRGNNSNTRWFRGKGKGKHTGSP